MLWCLSAWPAFFPPVMSASLCRTVSITHQSFASLCCHSAFHVSVSPSFIVCPCRSHWPPVIFREVVEDVHLVVVLQQAVGCADVVTLQHWAVIIQDCCVRPVKQKARGTDGFILETTAYKCIMCGWVVDKPLAVTNQCISTAGPKASYMVPVVSYGAKTEPNKTLKSGKTIFSTILTSYCCW